MYLRKRVGTPSEPADADLITRRADSLFDYAVTVSGCEQPLIALNELWGASLPTPLTPTAERYRANVLRFVTRLAERGGRPPCSCPASRSPGATRRLGGERSGRCPTSSSRSTRTPTSSGVTARSTGRDACAPAIGHRRRSCSRWASRRPGSGSWSASRPARDLVGGKGSSRARAGSTSRSGRDWRRIRGFPRASTVPRLVLGLGPAQRTLERSRQDVRRMRVAVGAGREPLRSAADPRKELDPDRRTGQIDLAVEVRCVYEDQPLSSVCSGLPCEADGRSRTRTDCTGRTPARERARAAVSPTRVLATERRIVASRFAE